MSDTDEVFARTLYWTPVEGAAEKVLANLQAEVGFDLPADYVEFLRRSNGGEGEFGIEPGWFQIWPAEEVIELNLEYEVAKYLPGFFAFGSSGGGMLFAFDAQGGRPWRVVAIDAVGMENPENAIEIGQGFASFLARVGVICPP